MGEREAVYYYHLKHSLQYNSKVKFWISNVIIQNKSADISGRDIWNWNRQLLVRCFKAAVASTSVLRFKFQSTRIFFSFSALNKEWLIFLNLTLIKISTGNETVHTVGILKLRITHCWFWYFYYFQLLNEFQLVICKLWSVKTRIAVYHHDDLKLAIGQDDNWNIVWSLLWLCLYPWINEQLARTKNTIFQKPFLIIVPWRRYFIL